MPLRQANRGETRRFDDDDGNWLVLRVELTKGERDRIRDLSVASRYEVQKDVAVKDLTPEDIEVEVLQRVGEANPAMFKMLCVEWSARDENDRAIPITEEAYRALDDDSGQWVDDCMAKVLTERRERAEKNGQSSTKSEPSESSSEEAEPPSGTPTPQTS